MPGEPPRQRAKGRCRAHYVVILPVVGAIATLVWATHSGTVFSFQGARQDASVLPGLRVPFGVRQFCRAPPTSAAHAAHGCHDGQVIGRGFGSSGASTGDLCSGSVAQEGASAAQWRGRAFSWLAAAWPGAATAIAAATARRLSEPSGVQGGRRGAVTLVSATEETSVSSSTTQTPVPVWVVNLDKSTDRWHNCEEEFAKQDVIAERFPATLGKALTEDELQEKVTFGGRYFCTPGMLGCFMSHLRIWERVVKEGHEAAVALEDDVVLFSKFNERLATILKELPSDWDVCLLGAVGNIQTEYEPFYMKLYGMLAGGGRASPGKTRGVSENLYVPYKPAGTHAYMVSQRGAKKLLEHFPKARYHVDLTAWSLKSLRLYAAKEFLATQRFEDDTTVSKEGAPLTKRFLMWAWEVSGLAAMGRRGGVPNLTWAWKTAIFALPVPFSSKRRRIIVEMGPSSSLFVVMLCMAAFLRQPKLVGWALLYMSCISFVIRWLAGTHTVTTTAALTGLSAAFIVFG